MSSLGSISERPFFRGAVGVKADAMQYCLDSPLPLSQSIVLPLLSRVSRLCRAPRAPIIVFEVVCHEFSTVYPRVFRPCLKEIALSLRLRRVPFIFLNFISNMSNKHFHVTGVPAAGTEVPQRKNFDDFAKDTDVLNLYLLALDRIQNDNQSALTSHFQVGGPSLFLLEIYRGLYRNPIFRYPWKTIHSVGQCTRTGQSYIRRVLHSWKRHFSNLASPVRCAVRGMIS